MFFIILITLYSCAKKEPNVVGVYINKFDTYKHGALHYLVVNEDSTYNHIYILENDTMYIKDKWFIYLSNHWNIVFDNWESMGCEKKKQFFQWGKHLAVIYDFLWLFNYRKRLSRLIILPH